MADYPRLYNPGPIEPIIEPGQNLLLQTPTGYDLFQVVYIDTFPFSAPITVNLATSGLAAATTTAGISTGQTPVNLQNQEDMNNGEVGHYRFRVLDPVQVSLFQPSALGRNTNQYARATFGPQSWFRDRYDSFSEHFVYEQNPAYMTAVNYQSVAVGQARVSFYGFRYILGGKGQTIGAQGGSDVGPVRHFGSLADAIAAEARKEVPRFTVIPISGWGA